MPPCPRNRPRMAAGQAQIRLFLPAPAPFQPRPVPVSQAPRGCVESLRIYEYAEPRRRPPAVGASPSGKALDFDSSIRRFDPFRPSQHPVGLRDQCPAQDLAAPIRGFATYGAPNLEEVCDENMFGAIGPLGSDLHAVVLRGYASKWRTGPKRRGQWLRTEGTHDTRGNCRGETEPSSAWLPRSIANVGADGPSSQGRLRVEC